MCNTQTSVSSFRGGTKTMDQDGVCNETLQTEIQMMSSIIMVFSKQGRV